MSCILTPRRTRALRAFAFHTGQCEPGQKMGEYHLGYGYLAEDLVRQGFIVVSINANRYTDALSLRRCCVPLLLTHCCCRGIGYRAMQRNHVRSRPRRRYGVLLGSRSPSPLDSQYAGSRLALSALDCSDASNNLARGRHILRHLQLLSLWNSGLVETPASLGTSLQGQLDLQHVGLVGHSRGGKLRRSSSSSLRSTWHVECSRCTVRYSRWRR